MVHGGRFHRRLGNLSHVDPGELVGCCHHSIRTLYEAFSWVAAAVGVGIAAGSAITGHLVDLIGADQTRTWVTMFAAGPAAITLGMRLLQKRRTT